MTTATQVPYPPQHAWQNVPASTVLPLSVPATQLSTSPPNTTTTTSSSSSSSLLSSPHHQHHNHAYDRTELVHSATVYLQFVESAGSMTPPSARERERERARAVVNCTRTTDGLNPRSYGLVISLQSGATIITAITPQLSFSLVSENSVLVGDLRNPYTLQLRTKEETEEFCKHVLVAKMASTAPNTFKAVQSIDLAPGVASPRSSMMAEHRDQATVLLTCWLVNSNHTIASTPHWTSATGGERSRSLGSSGDNADDTVTVNVKKARAGAPPLGMGEGLQGMRLNGTRLLVLQTSQRQGPNSGSSSLKSVLGLPPQCVCLFKVQLIKLKKEGADHKRVSKEKEKEKEQKHARDKGRGHESKDDKKRVAELKAEVRELEAKLRISQDTTDKMMGRRLERASVEELASLEEILLTSYKLVVAQKIRIEHREDEKNKARLALECVLCLDKARNAVLVPCGHACCCLRCAKKLTTCPLCRKEITDKLAIYL